MAGSKEHFVPTGRVELGFTLPMGDYTSLRGSISMDFRYDQEIEPQLDAAMKASAAAWRRIDEEIEVLVVDSGTSVANKAGIRVRIEDLEQGLGSIRKSLNNVADELRRQKTVLAEQLSVPQPDGTAADGQEA